MEWYCTEFDPSEVTQCGKGGKGWILLCPGVVLRLSPPAHRLLETLQTKVLPNWNCEWKTLHTSPFLSLENQLLRTILEKVLRKRQNQSKKKLSWVQCLVGIWQHNGVQEYNLRLWLIGWEGGSRFRFRPKRVAKEFYVCTSGPTC